jgi:hypothetical protein
MCMPESLLGSLNVVALGRSLVSGRRISVTLHRRGYRYTRPVGKWPCDFNKMQRS